MLESPESTHTPVVVANFQANGLGVARSLYLAGYRNIVGLDPHPYCPGRLSRCIRHFLAIPDPRIRPDQTLEWLVLAPRKFGWAGKAWLIPTNDEYAVLFAENSNALARSYNIAGESNPEIVELLLNKVSLATLAESVGVPVPAGTSFSHGSQVSLKHLQYPVIVKPAVRRSPGGNAGHIPRLRVCETEAVAERAIKEYQRLSCDGVVQTIVDGSDSQLVTNGIAAVNGRIVASFVGRKLRQFPPGFGEAALAEAHHCPEVEEASNRIVSTAGFTGIAELEFKMVGTEPVLIEVNPRSWSWNALSTASGVNLPALLLESLNGLNPVRPIQRMGNLRWSYAAKDFRFNGSRVGVLQVAQDVLSADVHAYWALTDPAPSMLAAVRSFAHLVARRLISFRNQMHRLSRSLSVPRVRR